jgi:hypothetical protein
VILVKITETKIKISDLCENYHDDAENGVFGFSDKLQIRPKFQREFVYSDKQRKEVINSVIRGFPLNTMYWSKVSDDLFEVLDGQQRTISICQYVSGDFSVKIDDSDRFFHNLSKEDKDKILNYELSVYICEGTESEKLAWFRVINIAGATLTDQELLNATYAGTWLSDAKMYFSKKQCVASKISDGYVKANTIRQELLEKAIDWIANRDGLKTVQMYMAIHQHDDDANEIWVYFQNVINWTKTLFPKIRKGVTDSQNWGYLYNKYHNNTYNTNKLEAEIQALLMDDDVTKKSGIIEYILSDRTHSDEKYLSIRAFTPSQKMKAYERQNHKCPICMANGIDVEYDFDDMQGDHIVPWSKGGHTVDSNLQMLCTKCNRDKGNN